MKSLVQKASSVGLMLAWPAMFVQAADLSTVGDKILSLIELAGQIIIALVFIYFIVGLMKYLLGDAKSKEESRTAIIYSLLIMFVLFSVWGIINLLQNTFGVGTGSAGSVTFPTANPG